MIPYGILSTIIHSITILVFTPRAWLKTLSILAVLCGAFLPFAVAAGTLAYEKSGIPATISERTVICGTDKYAVPQKAVALRLDDIQAHSWRDLAIDMIDDAITRKFFTSAVTIPLHLERDMHLIGDLRARNCYLDIALHGFFNTENPPEFAHLNYDESAWRLDEGLTNLKLITSKKVTLFIPPENQMSEEAKKAAADRGLHISAEGNNYLDYDATTYDFHEHYLVDNQTVLNNCEKAWQTEGKCIIMLHPQDYAYGQGKDAAKYPKYVELLDALVAKGAQPTTLSALAQKKESSK